MRSVETSETVLAIGDRIGPYRVVRLLGRGGMGEVWEARGEGVGDPCVAVKVARRRPGAARALRREARALVGLDHPGVVRIIDWALEAEHPWFAMARVEGLPLRARLPTTSSTATPSDATATATETAATPATQPPRPGPDARSEAPHDAAPTPAWPALRPVFVALCETLAWLHARGVVHLDLKPENILLTASGPVLIDFGLAEARRESGREVLGRSARGGTRSYIAPERRFDPDAPPDARADLWALGCMLFEATTGLHPAFTATPFAPDPQPLAPALSPALAACIRGLLTPDPADRIAYALDVLPALGVIAPVSPSDRALYRPTFVGRERALGEALGALEGAAATRGPALWIEGEAGIGKTRFLRNLDRRLRRAGVTLVAASSPPPGSALGTSAFAQLVQRLVDLLLEHERRQDTDDASPGGVRRVVGDDARWLAHADPRLGDAVAVADGSAAAALHRVLNRATSELGPLVVGVDDLQWAGPAIRVWLGAPRGGAAYQVLASARPDPSDEAELADLRAAAGTRLVLGGLAPAEIAALVASMLVRRSAPAPLAAVIERRSGGNPFFAAEYLRATVSAGLLGYRDGSWALDLEPRRGTGAVSAARPGGAEAPDAPAEAALEAALPLPDALRHLALPRIARLRDPARRLLQLVARVARPVEPELLARFDPLGADRALRELLAEGLLERTDGGAYATAHETLRQVVLERTSGDAAAALHAAIADALGDDDPAELAHHSAAAGRPDIAAEHYDAAIATALERGRRRRAAALLDARLDLPATPHARIEMLMTRAALRTHMGERTGAIADAERAATLADAHGLPKAAWRARLRRASTAQIGGDQRAVIDALETLAESPPSALDEARRRYELGCATYALGELDAAEDHFAAALSGFRAAGEQRECGHVHRHVGLIARRRGRFDDARAALERARDLLTDPQGRALDPSDRDLAVVTTNLGTLDLHQGGPRRATIETLRAALALHRNGGDVVGEGMVLNCLGIAYRDLGELERAKTVLERAATRLEGHREGTLGVGFSRCECLLRLGEIDAAAEVLRAARALVGTDRVLALDHGFAALFAEARGELGEAIERADAARAAFEAEGDPIHGALATVQAARCARRARGEPDPERLGDLRAASALLEARTAHFAVRGLARLELAFAVPVEAAGHLAAARALVEAHGAGPESELCRHLAAAERALAQGT